MSIKLTNKLKDFINEINWQPKNKGMIKAGYRKPCGSEDANSLLTIRYKLLKESHAASTDQTVFNYSFKIDSANQIQVRQNGTLLYTGYTVDGIGDANGGNITLDAAADLDDLIEIIRPSFFKGFNENDILQVSTIKKSNNKDDLHAQVLEVESDNHDIINKEAQQLIQQGFAIEIS